MSQVKQETLRQKYERLLKSNTQAIQTSVGKPLSRGYLSLDLDNNNELAGEEAEKQKQAYHADKTKMAKTKPQYFHNKLRQALIDVQAFPTRLVDEEMKNIDANADIPASLI